MTPEDMDAMKVCKPILVALAAAGVLAAPAAGQLPLAAVPAAPADTLGIAPGPTAPPVTGTLWSKLGISKEQKEFCKRKLCKTPFGQLLSNATAPLSALSGGLIPPFCPLTPSIAELNDPGAVGAAAKVMADEAGAAARKAAVRYLASVDCHYWPEAEDALIGALRGDRNECVRFEAALALGQGCCCTKKTIEALAIVVSCSNRDGAPKETSPRVHTAAQAALDHCLACYANVTTAPLPAPPAVKPELGPPPIPETAPEKKAGVPATTTAASKPVVVAEAKPGPGAPEPAAAPAAPVRPVGFAYYARIAQQPLAAILAEARRVQAEKAEKAEKAAVPLANTIAAATDDPLPPGKRTLMNLLAHAAGPDEVVVVEGDPKALAKADVVSPKPVNLWDIMNGDPQPTITPVVTVAPPLAKVEPVVKKPAPLPARTHSVVAVPAPTTEPPSNARLAILTGSVPAPSYGPALAPEPAPTTTWKSAYDAPSSSPYNQAGEPMMLPMPTPTPTPTPTPMSVPAPKMVVQSPRPLPSRMPAGPALVAPVPAPRVSVVAAPVVMAPAPVPVLSPVAAPVVALVAVPKPSARVRQVLTALSEETTAPEREAAANGLAPEDVRACPEVVPLLVKAARDDDAVAVRKACIRALVRCQADAPSVLSTLEVLSDDPVPAVRGEAIIGVARLKVAAAGIRGN